MNVNLATHNGTLTLTNPATGEHRTFRVKTQPDDAKFAPGQRIVSLLTGPDNTSDYTGFAFVNELGHVYCWTKKRGTIYERYARMLTDLAGVIERNKLEVNFEGRCRICNRPLTTPESVESGIGPVCAGRVSPAGV